MGKRCANVPDLLRSVVMKTTRIELGLKDARWTGWIADLHWESLKPDGTIGKWSIEGRVTCVGITLTSVPTLAGSERPADALELTTRLIRSVPWSSLIDAARTALLQQEVFAWDQPMAEELLRQMGLTEETPKWREWREQHRSVFAEQLPTPDRFVAKRSGRPPLYGPDHYAEVMAVYAEALRVGENPTQAVADSFPKASRAQAAKWVAKARALFPNEFPPPPIGRTGAPPKSRRQTS